MTRSSMEENQEPRRHSCKLCHKSFLSGKVLGGHMRCHMPKKSAKKEKEPINETDIDIEGGERASYILRENPKKSWKFSGPSHETSEEGNLCKVCGKGFDSPRALFGHLRHHSGKRKKEVRCKECGKEFESLRALTAHMRIHSESLKGYDESSNASSQKRVVDGQYTSEVSRLVRRKRSRRSRYKITQICSLSNLSGSSNVTESQKEVEEAATCLLMMSRGIRNWDGFSSSPESSDNNSAILEVNSLNQNQKIVNNDGENYTCDDDMAFKIKKPKQEMVGIEDTIGNMLCEGVVEKMPKLYDESIGEMCNNEIERKRLDLMSKSCIEVENFDEVDGFEFCTGKAKENSWNQMVFGSSKSEVLDDFAKKSEYKCRTCNKIFYSHQSLGGHQTVHRTPKSSLQINNIDIDTIVCDNTFFEVEEAKYIENSMGDERVSTNYEFKEHKCSICSKVFSSGRALGGHKRAHSVKDSENEAEEITLLKQELSGICEAFGPNVPIDQLEDEGNADVKLNSWWVKNEHKLELLVGNGFHT